MRLARLARLAVAALIVGVVIGFWLALLRPRRRPDDPTTPAVSVLTDEPATRGTSRGRRARPRLLDLNGGRNVPAGRPI